VLGDGRGDASKVAAACTRARLRSGAPEVEFALARALLVKGDRAKVIALARVAEGDGASRIWHLAGDASIGLGDRDGARAWYERALEALRRRDPLRASNSASRLADLARAEEAIDVAIGRLHEAIDLAGQSKDLRARLLAALGMSELLVAVGDTRGAANILAEAAAIVEAPENELFRRDYLLARATVDARNDHRSAAAAGFERCLEDPPPTADPKTLHGCELGLADLLARAPWDRIAQAEALVASARRRLDEIAQNYGDVPEATAEIELLEARIAARRGRPDIAQALFRRVHESRAGPAIRSRAGVALARLLLADDETVGEAERVLRASTAAVELLRDGAHYRETHRAMPEELRTPYELLFVLRREQGDLAGALASMERVLERDFIDQLTAGPAPGSAAVGTADLRAAARRARARQILDQRSARPADASLELPHGSITFAFFSAEGVLWRVVVTGPTVDIEAIAPVGDLAPDLDEARRRPGSQAAGRLRARLFPPALLPAPGTSLQIVPDRALEGIRFAALPGADGFLIERHALSIAPSLRVAAAGQELASAGPSVVLGDPDRSLVHSLEEAQQVAARFGTTPDAGLAANRAALSKARRAAVLHVASHGKVLDGRTVLLLADGPIDGADVLDLDLAPRLAVLASCTSAAQQREAMWTSVAAGLLAAGAHGVIGALGSIPDPDAKDLALAFYRADGATRPVTALARVQRDAIRRGVPVEIWSTLAYLGAPESADGPQARTLGGDR
jgi:tetratricopeptide (TPR) repeat protein